MIAEAVHPSQYGRAYGFHRAMDTCGALIGVVVALILVRWVSLRDILIWAVVPGLIAFALTLTLREIPRAAVESVPQIDQSRRSHRELWESVRATASPGYWNAMVILALFAFANSSDTFLLLRAKEAGLDDAQTTLAYLGYNVVAAAASYTSGVWGDRFGHRRVLLIGLAVFVVAYAGFAWTPSSAWLIPLFVTYGLYYALTHGIAKAIVAIHSPIESRASAIGAVAMVTGIATLMGNLTTGALWSWAGSSAALLASSAIALCALAIGVLWKPTEATSSQVDSNQ